MSGIPPADLGYIQERYRAAARAVVEGFEDANEPPALHASTPHVLVDALDRLFAVIGTQDPLPVAPGGDPAAGEAKGEAKDIHALAAYGLGLLADLGEWARTLKLPEPHAELRRLIFAFAVWLAQRGAELTQLTPVVDSLAFVANRIRNPQELEQMYLAATQIAEAVDPVIAQDMDHGDPARPWRILLLNRAIIATRSHQPALMEQAFQVLVEALPEDAAGFFREGMEQMEALGYPQPVREVMEKYFQLWCTPKILH